MKNVLTKKRGGAANVAGAAAVGAKAAKGAAVAASVAKAVGAANAAGATKVASTVSLAGAAADITLFHKIAKREEKSGKQNVAICIGVLVVLVAVIVFGALNYDAAQETNFAAKNLAPSLKHPFGTDWMGRDMFLRTMAGLCTSVCVGLLAAFASSLVALVLGIISALGPRIADAIVSFVIDLVMGIPHIVLLLLISFALGKGAFGIIVGVALTHWPSLARVIRAELLQCKQAPYVKIAHKLGKSPLSIARHHFVPFVLPQFLVGCVLLFPHAVLHEAAITFLGFGLPVEMPAIGVILSEAMTYLSAGEWWLALFPGLSLVLVVMLVDVAGHALANLKVGVRNAK